MYRDKFGTKGQVFFRSKSEYYEFLGYLAKGDGSTRLVLEHNDEQGAWAEEGRIHFYVKQPASLRVQLVHTAGTGNILSRVNCNDFLDHIVRNHSFVIGGAQNSSNIRSTVPVSNQADFDRGSAL